VDDPAHGHLLTALSIFGRLAYRHLDTAAVIGRENMRESLAYHQTLGEGRLRAPRANTLVNREERLGAQAAAQVADAVNALEDHTELGRLHRADGDRPSPHSDLRRRAK
jgi:hypothetical protein